MAILSVRNEDGPWIEIPAIVLGSEFVESEEYRGCYYHMVNGEKEWVNPPLVPDEEYRTTERLGDEPAYIQTRYCFELPNNAVKTINHNISNISKIGSACGYAKGITNTTECYYFPLMSSITGVGEIGLYATNKVIQITTTEDWTGYAAHVVLKYTKYK